MPQMGWGKKLGPRSTDWRPTLESIELLIQQPILVADNETSITRRSTDAARRAGRRPANTHLARQHDGLAMSCGTKRRRRRSGHERRAAALERRGLLRGEVGFEGYPVDPKGRESFPHPRPPEPHHSWSSTANRFCGAIIGRSYEHTMSGAARAIQGDVGAEE
jgi:hypothetical protein